MSSPWIHVKDLTNVIPASQRAWLYINSRWEIHNEDGTEVIGTAWCDGSYPVVAYATAFKKKTFDDVAAYLIADDIDGLIWVVHSIGNVCTRLVYQDNRPNLQVQQQHLRIKDPERLSGEYLETTHPLDEEAVQPEFVLGN